MTQPILTIVTVVRNGGSTLAAAIESVTRQDNPAVEYIVIDGASTDDSVEIIARYARHLAFWQSEPDGGIYDAMNKAMQHARGKWLLFLGADDQICIDFASIIPKLQDERAVYYGNVRLARNARIRGGRFSTFRLSKKNICHQAIFYPRAVYATKSYACDAGALADYQYNIELWGRQVRFRYIDDVISIFNDKGTSSGDPRYFEGIKNQLIRDHLGFPYYQIKRVKDFAAKLFKGRAQD